MKQLLLITIVFLTATFCFAQNTALFYIREKGKTGYIDNTGKVVIKPQFDYGEEFSEGVAPVQIGEDWGYIDETGKIIVKPRFFEALSFKKGFARVGIYFKNHKIVNNTVGYYGYINKKGIIVHEKDVKDTDVEFSDGLLMFRTNKNEPDSKIGYKDKNGNIVIKPKYDSGTEFSEGLTCVISGNNTNFIDTKGNIIIDLNSSFSSSFYECSSFSEGLAAVCNYDKDGFREKCGFIDKTGKMVIKLQFADVESFSDGVAVVKVFDNSESDREGRYGVIDKTGNFIIPAKYGQIGDFSNGLAIVSLDGSFSPSGPDSADKWGYINKEGKIVWRSL